MVKLKKKSRRQKLSQKYTIEKKVREHRRAMRKAAKQRGGPIRKKHRKDPGIPNSFPFKTELLLTIQARKRQQEAARQASLLAKKSGSSIAAGGEGGGGAGTASQAAAAAAGDLLGSRAEEAAGTPRAAISGEEAATATEDGRACDGLKELAASALERAAAYYDWASASAADEQGPRAVLAEGSGSSGNGADSSQDLWGVGSFASGRLQHVLEQQQRQQQQQLRRVLQQADVIIEVIDARMPEAFRCLGLERAVLAAGKKLVLLLNKIDLVPVEAGIAWLQHLQQHAAAPVLAMKCPRSAAAAKRFAARRPHISSNSSSGNKPTGAAAAAAQETAAGTLAEKEEEDKGRAHHRSNLLPLFSDGKDSLRRSAAQVLGADALLRLLHSMAYGGDSDATAAAAPAALSSNSNSSSNSSNSSSNSSNSSSNSSSSGSSRNRSRLRKKHLVVGVVGYPNVGKSSLINVLRGSGSAAAIAALPGSTKVAQVVKLDKHISLVDTPGVLFRASVDAAVLKTFPNSSSCHPGSSSITARPDSSTSGGGGADTSLDSGDGAMEVDTEATAAAGTVEAKDGKSRESEVSPFLLQSLLPVSRVENPAEVAGAVAACCSKETLQRVYRISADFDTSQQLLAAVAHSRGKLRKGGIPDIDAAARLFLQDWQKGVIPYYTLPPPCSNANLEKVITWKTGDVQQQQQQEQQQQREGGDGGATAATVGAATATGTGTGGSGGVAAAPAANAGDAEEYKQLLQWQCAALAADQGLTFRGRSIITSTSSARVEATMEESKSREVQEEQHKLSAALLTPQQQEQQQQLGKRVMLLRFRKGLRAAAAAGRGEGDGSSHNARRLRQQQQKTKAAPASASQRLSRATMQHVAVRKKAKEAMKRKRKAAAREEARAGDREISLEGC